MLMFSAVLVLPAILNTASAADPEPHISIEQQDFMAERIVHTGWSGEPMVGDVRNYGIDGITTLVAFFTDADFEQIAQMTLREQPAQAIHAIHLHGVGEGTSLEQLHGYTVIAGDDASGEYTMATYSRSNDASLSALTQLNGGPHLNSSFQLHENFSSSARGALDCGSAAKIAILHSPAAKPIISMTLARTDYSQDPQSEDKFASYLTNVTTLLALERRSMQRAGFEYDSPLNALLESHDNEKAAQ